MHKIIEAAQAGNLELVKQLVERDDDAIFDRDINYRTTLVHFLFIWFYPND